MRCPRPNCGGTIFLYDNPYLQEYYYLCHLCARQFVWQRGELREVDKIMGIPPELGQGRKGVAMVPGKR